MTARAAWLEQWCPRCHAAPGHRCRLDRWQHGQSQHLHVARGWLQRPCGRCKAPEGEPCITPNGRVASQVHASRLTPARWELVLRTSAFEALERRGATIATVSFWGRAGKGGHSDVIRLLRGSGERLVEVERWTGRDELCYALEAPIWERFGTFAGHPLVRGDVIWTTADRRVVIVVRRGERQVEERVG